MGGRIDILSRRELLRGIEGRIRQGRFTQILSVNPLMLEAASQDPALAEIFSQAHFCAPESAGMAIIAHLKGIPIQETIPGIELMADLCAMAEKNGWPVCFVGGKPGVGEKTVQELRKRYPGLIVAGVFHGYLSDDEERHSLGTIKKSNPKLIFAALGVPRQEKWIFQNRKILEGAAALGVGGSFDVISGNLRRSPLWLRRVGLEWLFRCLQEPWRFRRAALTARAVFLAISRPIS